MLSPALKKIDTLTGHETMDSLATDYLKLKQQADKSVVIPGEKATDDELMGFYKSLLKIEGVTAIPDLYSDDKAEQDKFWSKLGRPQLPEEYKFSEGVNNKLKGIPEFVKEAKEAFHDVGLNIKQANKLMEKFTKDSKEYDIEKDLYLELKCTFGDAVQLKLQQSLDNMEKLAETRPEIKSLMNSPQVKYNPAIVEVFSKLKITDVEGAKKPEISFAPKQEEEAPTEEASSQVDAYLAKYKL